MATGKFVAYYRVSTDRQGASGLGLEAQKKAVTDYLNGGKWALVGEFTDIESGKHDDRPALAKAFAACRLHRATLVIAKLDRLSRNSHFLTRLRDEKVDFVCADMPDANKLTITILLAVAEHEREAISTRTRAALAAAKARGQKLGNPNGISAEAQAKGAIAGGAAARAKAAGRAADLAPVIREIQGEGHTSLSAIASALNGRHIEAPRGGMWVPVQVSRVLARIA